MSFLSKSLSFLFLVAALLPAQDLDVVIIQGANRIKARVKLGSGLTLTPNPSLRTSTLSASGGSLGSITGLVKAASGTPAVAVPGTDYIAPSGPAVVSTIAVGGGTTVTRILKGSVTATLGTNGASSPGGTAGVAVTVTGAAVGDYVQVTPRFDPSTGCGSGPVGRLLVTGYVTATNTVTLYGMAGGASCTLGSQTFDYILFK